VRSASRHSLRLGALAACGALLAGGAIGCSTTQEKAAEAQAQAEQILKARAKRQHQKKQVKQAKQNLRKENGGSRE
jgi:hypothetical protein